MDKTREEIVEEVRALIQKTGRVYVAEDVFAALVADGDENKVGWSWGRYGSINIIRDRYLAPGTILAVDPSGYGAGAR